MAWKTYLIMYFGTDGVKPSDVAKLVEALGFVTMFGSVDFIYDWGAKEPTKADSLALGDKVAAALHGSGVVFNLDTHE